MADGCDDDGGFEADGEFVVAGGRPGPWPATTSPAHRDPFQDRDELRAVTPLTSRDDHREGLTALLTRQMRLHGEPTPRTPEPMIRRLVLHPTRRLPLHMPVATGTRRMLVRARLTVESPLTVHAILPAASPAACNAARTCAQVPSRCQQRNHRYNVCHGACTGNTSHHGTPVRTRHRIPFTTSLLAHLRGRSRPHGAGSNGSSKAHCASVRS
ncbi:hypothetical protein GCM10018962_20270 [Dactylosporangium matsuzakiense]|uniref:Uncharacterized protein n=1 Tax=Dactylosporangium matsuzakiense TaxID=53360 RepID=A0A9W6KPW2_9ACTN|nr:hypothetical protein GCM10017581_051140 [Dactylosporangium matsuzakiense]